MANSKALRTMKRRSRTSEPAMEEAPQVQENDDHHQHQEQPLEMADAATFTSTSDLCQQLLDRYSKSSASQHSHLCATAVAMRSIVESESLPLTPPAYFAATIYALSETTPDSTSAAALLSFLSLALPLVPIGSIPPPKAEDAVSVLVNLVETQKNGEAASTATARAVVKCLGVLVGFCNSEEWDSIKLGFQRLLLYSVDKRPKVRKCAQVFVEKVMSSSRSSGVTKEAGKLMLSLLKDYKSQLVQLNAPKTRDTFNPEQLESVHMLSVAKIMIPFLSVKTCSKILSQLSKLLSPQSTPLTRHIFNAIDASFETSEVEVIISEAETIIASLAEYVCLVDNPVDTVISAATLLKRALDRLHVAELSMWSRNFPLVCRSIAGLLTMESVCASHASGLLIELINDHIGQKRPCCDKNQSSEEVANRSYNSSAIKSICSLFEDVLGSCDGHTNEHILLAISALFIELGEESFFFTKALLMKLADLMANMYTSIHLHECIGSAVIAMGPEKVLTLLPISFHAEDKACSNFWLVTILKKHVAGASLGYFLEHIVPLSELIKQASSEAKESAVTEDLQNKAYDLLGLLPAFCRSPTDLHQNIMPLTKFLISSLSDTSLHQTVAVSLQELVQENCSILSSNQGENDSSNSAGHDYSVYSNIESSHSKSAAKRNIRALVSFSMQLLQSLVDVLYDSPPEKHSLLKGAIGCLASITDPSVTKKIFLSSLKRFQFLHTVGEIQDVVTKDSEEGNLNSSKDKQWCLVLGLAYSLVKGANEDLIDLIYKFVKHALLAANNAGRVEAYYTLNHILEEHPWFCSSLYAELVELLLDLKPPFDTDVLRSRFTSFQLLLCHALKEKSVEEDTKPFLILNEIILAMKDSDDEARKAAYDILLSISSSLKNSSAVGSNAPQHKLINMIMGYLSGSSPQIKSAAVSALSLLLYKDTDICLSMPEIISSLSALLQSKAVEVIKATLGFMKVLVSCLQAKDLQSYLADILNGVLPWSSISRNHFRSKVTVILEIMIRKCGSAAVQTIAPEKYKGFIRTVKENHHHGKPASRDPNSAVTEPKSTDTSSKRQSRQKRPDDDPNMSHEKNISFAFKKRKRENNFGMSTSSNESHLPNDKKSKKNSTYSNTHKRMKAPPGGRGTSLRRDFSSGKRNKNQAKGNGKVGGRRPDSALKSNRSDKMRRKSSK